MVAKKKRASFSKTPHIAAQAVVTTMEDDDAPASTVPVIEVKKRAEPVVVESKTEKTTPIDVATPSDEPSFEEILEQDADESELSKKNAWMYRIGFIVTCVIVAVSISIFLVSINQSQVPPKQIASTVTPTPFPTIAVNPSMISIEVLNGSGVAGRAGKAAATLKAKGYTIVGTGNANKSQTSQLFASLRLSEQEKALLLVDMQEFGVSSISAGLTNSTASAQLILGVK